jgi:hypothetical protein
MPVLFQGYDTYVSEELIEHKGQKYDPSTLSYVVVTKDKGDRKSIIWCSVIAFFSLIAIFAWGWTTIGLIALLLSGAFGGWLIYQDKQDKVLHFVTVAFQTSYTGSGDLFTLSVFGEKKAREIENALGKSKELNLKNQ